VTTPVVRDNTMYRRLVVGQFAALLGANDDLWQHVADVLIDTRDEDGEPVDHLVRALRQYAAQRP
jgi:hypothetical protein